MEVQFAADPTKDGAVSVGQIEGAGFASFKYRRRAIEYLSRIEPLASAAELPPSVVNHCKHKRPPLVSYLNDASAEKVAERRSLHPANLSARLLNR